MRHRSDESCADFRTRSFVFFGRSSAHWPCQFWYHVTRLLAVEIFRSSTTPVQRLHVMNIKTVVFTQPFNQYSFTNTNRVYLSIKTLLCLRPYGGKNLVHVIVWAEPWHAGELDSWWWQTSCNCVILCIVCNYQDSLQSPMIRALQYFSTLKHPQENQIIKLIRL
jgi:hypothetical protein